MTAGESAVVIVAPSDTIETILDAIRQQHTTSLQLLVESSSTALHSAAHCSLLRRYAEEHQLKLLIVTTDDRTVEVAEASRLETILLDPASARAIMESVLVAQEASPGVDASKSQAGTSAALLEEALLAPPMAPTRQIGRATRRIESTDDDFAAELDAAAKALDDEPKAPMPIAPAVAAAALAANQVASNDRDLAAELDDLSDVMAAAPQAVQRNAASDEEALAAELDALSEATAQSPRVVTLRPNLEQPVASKPETKPGQAAPRLERKTRPRPAEPLPTPPPAAAEKSDPAWRKYLPLLLVLLLIFIAIWFFAGTSDHAEVAITPLSGNEGRRPFSGQTIFLAGANSEAGGSAVSAEMLEATVAYTVSGQIASETIAPAGTARGSIVIVSRNAGAISLPQGTEFIAYNAQNQEVHFMLDEPITIPGMTTVQEGYQIISTFGQARANITARTPGSGANIPAGAIRRILIPDQPPIDFGGALTVDHGPITTGSEQPIRLVKDSDVQALMSEALTGLYNQARQTLSTQTVDRNLTLEMTTLMPRSSDLALGEGYQVRVMPPVGSTVDPANPAFQVEVHAHFTALASPWGKPLPLQLQEAVTAQLVRESKLPDGLAPSITDWSWDGSRLTADGFLQPIGLDQLKPMIRHSLAGKPRTDAQNLLDQMITDGIIKTYTLPERDKLPGENQLDIRFTTELSDTITLGTPTP